MNRLRKWLDDPENRVDVVLWVIAVTMAAVMWLRFA
jgi:hypothetical protein